MKLLKKFVILFGLAIFFALATGCEEQGPMEKAGEQIDETIEKAGEKIEEGGEEIQEAVEDARDEIEESTEKMQNK